jgi:Outer membrane protein beta-barrel domain
MRNPFISIAFAFIALCTTIHVEAQNNKTSVSVGMGQFFNNRISGSYSNTLFRKSNTQQTSQFTPVVAIKWERRFLKYFSVGLDYNRLTAKSEQTNQTSGLFFSPATTSQEKIDAKISGISFNLKGFVYSNTAFDAYIGTNLGLLTTTESIDKLLISVDDPVQQVSSQETIKSITALLEANLGVRYFVTKNVGIYGEIGATRVYHLRGASYQGGVIYRF